MPVRFSGTSPGVKNGGIFVQSIRKVKVKTIPEHLVDELVADISKLKLNQSIRIRDLKLNEGVEIISDGAIPIASVTTPRALKTVGGIIEDEDEEGEEGEGEGEGESEGDNE